MLSTTSCRAASAAKLLPVGRSAPWCTSTRSAGAKRASSRCQLPTTDVGQTSSVGAAVVAAHLAVVQEQRDDLDRLAQAHVVGQAGAQSVALQRGQPDDADALVRAQGADEAGRLAQRGALPAVAQRAQQLVEPALDGSPRPPAAPPRRPGRGPGRARRRAPSGRGAPAPRSSRAPAESAPAAARPIGPGSGPAAP